MDRVKISRFGFRDILPVLVSGAGKNDLFPEELEENFLHQLPEEFRDPAKRRRSLARFVRICAGSIGLLTPERHHEFASILLRVVRTRAWMADFVQLWQNNASLNPKKSVRLNLLLAREALVQIELAAALQLKMRPAWRELYLDLAVGATRQAETGFLVTKARANLRKLEREDLRDLFGQLTKFSDRPEDLAYVSAAAIRIQREEDANRRPFRRSYGLVTPLFALAVDLASANPAPQLARAN